jgi:hypothetical protein
VSEECDLEGALRAVRFPFPKLAVYCLNYKTDRSVLPVTEAMSRLAIGSIASTTEKVASVEQFPGTNIFPLSIAQVDPTVYVEPELASALSIRTAADVPADEGAADENLLAAVIARAGEVEAAEWALDQAKAASEEQIAAALSSGLPVEKVAAAAGVCASVLPGLMGLAEGEPVPALAES